MKTKPKKSPKPLKKGKKPEKKLQAENESAVELTEKEMAEVSGGVIRLHVKNI